MSNEFHFAVKDGCVDARTGEKSESGLKVSIEGIDTQEAVQAFLEKDMPHFAGRLRPISKEEYDRDFEDFAEIDDD